MKFLGIEIRRVPKEEPPAFERMKAACDAMNEAWEDERASGGRTRPWVIWEEQRLVLTQWGGEREIIYE